MRAAALLLLLLPAGVFAQTPVPMPTPIPAPTPEPAAKLELPAAQTVPAGSGFVKLKASGAADVLWDVFGVFASPAQQVQSDSVGSTLYLGIPGTPGAVRITATAIVAGKLQQAVTFVTITGPAPAPDDPPQPAPVTGAKLSVTLIGVAESPTLRTPIEKAGHKLWVFASATDPKIAGRADLQAEIKQAGGVPCIVITDDQGNLKTARKLPFTSESLVLDLVNQAAKGQ